MKKIILILFSILIVSFPNRSEALDRAEVLEWANHLISSEWIRDEDGAELYVRADESGLQGVMGRAVYEIESVSFDSEQIMIITRFLDSDVACIFVFRDNLDSMEFENLTFRDLGAMKYSRS